MDKYSRVRINMAILNLLSVESVSGACNGRASLLNSISSPTANV